MEEVDKSKTFNALEEIEKSLSFESLHNNKALVYLMDDNLSIHVGDYIRDPTICSKFKFTREQVIAEIKNSKKYVYDADSGHIKLIEKPKRRIIVFRDIPKERQTNENIENLLKLSGYLLLDKKVKKIEKLTDLFFVYFENEEEAIEVFKWIERTRENNEKILPFKFSAFIKAENLKRQFISPTDEEFNFVRNMIPDTNFYIPRKLSNDTPHNAITTIESAIKLDKIEPYIPIKARESVTSNVIVEANRNIGNEGKHKKSFTQNKFDDKGRKNKRNKAYSINENYSYFNKNKKSLYNQVPLNKNYDTFGDQIKHTYNLKDITRIYLNMTLMKKFELPEEFKDGLFIKEAMSSVAKNNLEHFKEKKPINQTRERSYTYHDYTTNNYYNHRKSSRKSYQSNYDEYYKLRNYKQDSLKY